MQGPVLIVGEKVRYIDQERDRTQANRAQQVLQPCGGWAIFHTFDQAACEHRTAVKRISINANGQVGGKCRLDEFNLIGFHFAQATGRQITRNSVHAKRVRAVGCDRDFNHGVDFCRIVNSEPINKTITDIARRQFNDAVVFVGQFHLALGRHHAIGFDATDFADSNGRVDARHVNARFGDDDCDPLAGIWCAANDLQFAFIGVDFTDPQLIRIGVLFSVCHVAKGEILELIRRVLDTFDL